MDSQINYAKLFRDDASIDKWYGYEIAINQETLDLFDESDGTFENIITVLKEGGAGPEHIVRMTWYITDRDAYLNSVKDIGQAYRDVIGRNFPAMAVVQVVALMEAEALLEIEVTAVVPE